LRGKGNCRDPYVGQKSTGGGGERRFKGKTPGTSEGDKVSGRNQVVTENLMGGTKAKGPRATTKLEGKEREKKKKEEIGGPIA